MKDTFSIIDKFNKEIRALSEEEVKAIYEGIENSETTKFPEDFLFWYFNFSKKYIPS